MKKKKLKPIPAFKSYQEEAEFWDTHEATDYFDFSSPFQLEFIPEEKKDTVLNIRVSEKVKVKLKKIAKNQRRKTADMARLLIEKGLSEIMQSQGYVQT